MRMAQWAAALVVGLAGMALGAAEPAVIVKPVYGKPAPEIAVTDLQGKEVTLAGLKGKPVVLQFASLTEPVVRLHAKDVEKLAGTCKTKVVFLLVYQKEAHAVGTADSLALNVADGYSVPEAKTQDERIQLARQLMDKLAIANQRVLVDQWSNATATRYGALPNMTFLIDDKGNLAAAYPWMDPKKLQGAIADVLAGKPVADANMGPARTEQQPITIPDGLGNQGPGAGVVSAAVALDAMTLTDPQKAAVLKPLANYVAALRNLRDKTAAQAAATKPAVDQAAEQQKVADAARELKAALKQQLKPEDYQKLTDALSQGVGKQYFVAN